MKLKVEQVELAVPEFKNIYYDNAISSIVEGFFYNRNTALKNI